MARARPSGAPFRGRHETVYVLGGDWFPDERAGSHQTARMTQGFLDAGLSAVVAHPASNRRVRWEDTRRVYGLHRPLESWPLWDGPAGTAVLGSRRRRWALRLSLLGLARRARTGDVVYGRHAEKDPLAWMLRLKQAGVLRARIFVELEDQYPAAVHPAASGYVVNNAILGEYVRRAGVSEDCILVAPHAVDIDAYRKARSADLAAVRASLGCSDRAVLICYTGQLYQERNVTSLIAALAFLEPQFRLAVVGGIKEKFVSPHRAAAATAGVSGRVVFTGQLDAPEVRLIQCAADVLVLPYDSSLKAKDWCSPMKLPEYLCTGKPIVAFPTAPLHAELRDDEVVWVEAETPESLAEAIRTASRRPPRSIELVEERFRRWTWTDRARAVAAFIGMPPAGGRPWRMPETSQEGIAG